MSPEAVSLLLRKQRLQIRAAQQRQACLGLLTEFDRVASHIDRLQSSAQRVTEALRRHVWIVSVVGVGLLLMRPRGVVRWLQRGWLAYLGARRLRKTLDAWLTRLKKPAAG